MADKEATVYIVDVGSSMGEKNHGRKESDLEWSMRYVWDKITATVSTGRKTTLVGVIGLRTNGTQLDPVRDVEVRVLKETYTNNELSEEEAFHNISVLQPISQILMPQLRTLTEKIKPSKTDNGDAISAIILAIQLIQNTCKKLKYTRRIILVTNGRGSLDTTDLGDIIAKLKEDKIELTILGTDFDDADYGVKEEGKDKLKRQNEAVLKDLCEQSDGQFGTMEEAVDMLSLPRVKLTRPVPLFKGALKLGDSENYDTAMSIDVERYPRTMIARPPTASSYVVAGELKPGETQSTATVQEEEKGIDPDSLAAVKSARTYQVPDETAPGGKRDVERDELAKGYEYGRTAVHIAETDENVTKLETFTGLEIIGFVEKEKFERYLEMSRACLIIAQKGNEKAAMALSSFIHALYELESYAIGRLVVKDGKAPVIVLLAPSIEPDYECLIDVELPFAEDFREYRFPPLDRIVTISGKIVTSHRNLPTDDLKQAMSDYVDHMDLSIFGKDENGIPTEYMPMEDTYSPILHRIQSAIRFRAVHPNAEVPPPAEILTRFSKPPDDLIAGAMPYLDSIKSAGNVKKIPAKPKFRKRARSPTKPLSGLDVGALLHSERSGSEAKGKPRIDPANAVPEFKQLLETTESLDTLKTARNLLRDIIYTRIRNSVGDTNYSRALEEIRVMREEFTELEEPGLYNDFVKELKKRLLSSELGGDRREMWYLVRVNRLGLIGKEAAPGGADEKEAKEFLAST